MRRVFLDANVLFSAAYGSTGIRVLWRWAEEARHVLLVSDHVIEEARRNLTGPRQLSDLEDLVRGTTMAVPPPPDVPCPIALPEGDREAFLAAVAARATHFLTGDIRHFGSFYGKTYTGVLIQAPADYIGGFSSRRRSRGRRSRPG